MHKPLAVVLAFDERDQRQSVIADTIRAHWAELITLHPAERRKRIDELLKPKKDTAS